MAGAWTHWHPLLPWRVQEALEGVHAENAALKARCDEFVRSNLEHMLSMRGLQARADSLEGAGAGAMHRL